MRNAYGKLSGIVSIVANFFLFLGKLIVGILSASVSIQADAFNNLSDFSSGLISFFGFKMASRPADEDHPYGHARYEYLSGMLVSVFIIVVGVELFRSSLDRILHPEPLVFSTVTVVVLVCSILVKVWLMIFNRSLGKKIESGTLIATAKDSRNDVIATSVVLLSTVLSKTTEFCFDGWAGLVVAIFILVGGIGMVKDTMDPLLGKAPDKERIKHIYEKIMSYEGVLGTHDLMVHDYGPGRQFASVHVEMPAEADPVKCHETIDTIERDFLDEGLHMVIHYDPVVTDDSEIGVFREFLTETVAKIDKLLEVHDIRIVKGKRMVFVFDLVCPAGAIVNGDDLLNRIKEAVNKQYPGSECHISVENGYLSAK